MNALTDRRTMLRGLGVLSAGGAATVAAIPVIGAVNSLDPIFGVIEAHQAAWAPHPVACLRALTVLNPNVG
jgi:hypothetical protein